MTDWETEEWIAEQYAKEATVGSDREVSGEYSTEELDGALRDAVFSSRLDAGYAAAIRDAIVERDALKAEVEALKHIMECANTPLMRDVLQERDALKARAARYEGVIRAVEESVPSSIPTYNLDGTINEIGTRLSEDSRRAILRAALACRETKEGAEPHIIEDGSRRHVVFYDAKGPHCSEPNCEMNKPATKER